MHINNNLFSHELTQSASFCHALLIDLIFFHNAAHPHRHYDGPSRHVKRVGEPVRICNGVGEGSLGNHYRVQWYKNSIDLNEGSITRGEDFSLLLESVKRSDSGVYHSDVTVYDANNQNIEYVVTPDILIELIVYRKLHNACMVHRMSLCMQDQVIFI